MRPANRRSWREDTLGKYCRRTSYRNVLRTPYRVPRPAQLKWQRWRGKTGHIESAAQRLQSQALRVIGTPYIVNPLTRYLIALRRFLAACGLAVWLGGFTFYGAVVIPMGEQVLGSHRPVGFITQQ